jgi:hypothetical protein
MDWNKVVGGNRMKITENVLRNVTIILFAVMNITPVFFKNLRYQAFIGFIAIEMILVTLHALTNKPIKKSDKIRLIGVYLIAILALIYVFTKTFR